MAKNPKPIRRWRRKAMRWLFLGKSRVIVTKSGFKRRILSHKLTPRNLRLYR